MASQKIWELADDCGRDASQWTVSIAKKYNTYIGAGYLDKENGDYYNRYMIAGPDGVCGVVTKSEGESAVFKRGDFGSIIPHGSPADPNKPNKERNENDKRCMAYIEAFGVPVVYVNSIGELEYMPGKMGAMMKKYGFRMNGMSRIYAPKSVPINTDITDAIGAEVDIQPKKMYKEIQFYGEDILRGNWLFKHFILKPDTVAGIKSYENEHKKK